MSMDRTQIFQELRSILTTLFELTDAEVVPEARLAEDLDLDSIDAVDIIVAVQKRTGIKVRPEQFKTVKTVKDVVDVVDQLLNHPDESAAQAPASGAPQGRA